MLALKQRMERLGWEFDVDFAPDGRTMAPTARKLVHVGDELYELVADHRGLQFAADLKACRAALSAETHSRRLVESTLIKELA